MSFFRSHLTLTLCTILHAFTHAYATMLVPLYLMVQHDLNLPGVAWVSWIVTIYGTVYFLGSYAAGLLADRFNRKALLGIGLLGNAAAILLMGLTRDYHALIALAVLAGVAGTLFHPAANALAPAHYPKHPGMVIGIMGAGAGLGFWAGPQFAGYRAEHAAWTLGNLAQWQRPLVEAGLFGLLIGILFLFVAKEVGGPPASAGGAIKRPPLGKKLTRRTLAVASVLVCRDIAGVATTSLIAIFLLKAHGLNTAKVGTIMGTMMLSAVIVNPLSVYFSPGKRRLPSLSLVLLMGGLVIAIIPYVPLVWVLPVMCVYFALQLSSYAISDAAILERVPGAVRGRVVGLFLTYAGTISSTSPWIIGRWTDSFGERASQPTAYLLPFLSMTLMMWLGACSSPLIARLGQSGTGPTPEPNEEITPRTMPAVG